MQQKNRRTDPAVSLSLPLFLTRSRSYEVHDIRNDARRGVVGYDIAVVVAVLITRRRWGHVGVVRPWHRLKAIAGRNSLSANKVRTSLRTATPMVDIFAVVGLESPTVLIAEVKIIPVILMATTIIPMILLAMTIVVVVVSSIGVLLRDSDSNRCNQQRHHRQLRKSTCH